MLRASLVVAVALMIFVAMPAAAVDCANGGSGYANVTSAPFPGSCTLGPITFSDFAVGGSTPGVIGISGSSNFDGTSANLVFTVSPSLGPSDTILVYQASGGIQGVNMELGTWSGNVTITENVCTVNPTLNSNCTSQGGTYLAQYYVNGVAGPHSDSRTFAPQSSVWIKKDINIPSGATMSDFTNSHETPEPTTYLLIGSGLVALGFVRRYSKKRG